MSELLSQEEMTPDKNHHYFALDGNYGVADGMVVVDTQNWSEADWQAIDEVGDRDRATLALALARADERQKAELREAVENNDLDAQFDKAMEKE
jgi:hypothetical protein